MVGWVGVGWGEIPLSVSLSLSLSLSLSISLSPSGERSVRRTGVPNDDMLWLPYKSVNLGAEKSPGLA